MVLQLEHTEIAAENKNQKFKSVLDPSVVKVERNNFDHVNRIQLRPMERQVRLVLGLGGREQTIQLG